jgi:opacity protein-like surface antigen
MGRGHLDHRTVRQGFELFAYPWTRVSPYVTAGLTLAPRSFQDAYYDENLDQVQLNASDSMMFGPNVGLGVELALGKSIALDLEGRYTAFLGTDEQDPTAPGSFQTRAGVVVHFK